jgi:hypothetical protein
LPNPGACADTLGNPTISRILSAAEKLNTLRNRLAHHLDYPEIEAPVRDFLSLCEEPEDPEEPDDRETIPLARLRHSIVFVCIAFERTSDAAEFTRDLKRGTRDATSKAKRQQGTAR